MICPICSDISCEHLDSVEMERVKTRCVQCGKKIKWDLERYVFDGNFCKKCNGQAEINKMLYVKLSDVLNLDLI